MKLTTKTSPNLKIKAARRTTKDPPTSNHYKPNYLYIHTCTRLQEPSMFAKLNHVYIRKHNTGKKMEIKAEPKTKYEKRKLKRLTSHLSSIHNNANSPRQKARKIRHFHKQLCAITLEAAAPIDRSVDTNNQGFDEE